MNLLAAKMYDPAAAVTKATSALLAMTAIDTTNLRLAITVPAHGMVRFRMAGCIHGATTFPSVLLGVMNGATILGRLAPVQTLGNTAVATALLNVEAVFTVTGLTPGAMNVDAAYSVETIVAATGIKYGGPNNNTTANDAFGAFAFEAWDPQPQTANTTLLVDANGRVDVSKVSGTTQTARDLGAQLDATVSTRMATYTQPTGFLAATFPTTVASTTNISAGTITTVTNLTNAPTAGDLTATMKASVTTACTASTPTAAAVTGAVGSVTGNVGGNVTGSVSSVVGLTASNLDTTVSSRLSTAGYTAPLSAAGVRTAVGLASANLDSQLAALPDAVWDEAISGHLTGGTTGAALNGAGAAGDPWGTALPGAYAAGTAGYIVGNQLDAAVSSRLATVGYTAPDNSGITTLTSRLTSTRAGLLDNLDATVSSRSTYSGTDTSGTTTLLSRVTSGRATLLDNLDAAISTRSTYSGTDTSGTTTLLSRLSAGRATGLDNLDATVSSRLATAGYTSPDNAGITAIKAKTDSLAFTVAGKIDANVTAINGITVAGSGTAGSPWGP